jgi:hypothetical protein
MELRDLLPRRHCGNFTLYLPLCHLRSGGRLPSAEEWAISPAKCMASGNIVIIRTNHTHLGQAALVADPNSTGGSASSEVVEMAATRGGAK